MLLSLLTINAEAELAIHESHLRLKHCLNELKCFVRLENPIFLNKSSLLYQIYVQHIVHETQKEVYL